MENTKAPTAVKTIRTQSRYSEIAVWIAERIVQGQYAEGEKISARTSLSSSFKASAETVRKALSMLADLEIVEARQKSGFYVRSRSKAAEFVNHHLHVRTMNDLRQELKLNVSRQRKELQDLENTLEELEQVMDRSRMDLAFSPCELTITGECRFLNASIRDIQLWEHTGATVVAIAKDGELIISPGPLAVLEEGNVLYFVGSKPNMYSYLYQQADTQEAKTEIHTAP